MKVHDDVDAHGQPERRRRLTQRTRTPGRPSVVSGPGPPTIVTSDGSLTVVAAPVAAAAWSDDPALVWLAAGEDCPGSGSGGPVAHVAYGWSSCSGCCWERSRPSRRWPSPTTRVHARRPDRLARRRLDWTRAPANPTTGPGRRHGPGAQFTFHPDVPTGHRDQCRILGPGGKRRLWHGPAPAGSPATATYPDLVRRLLRLPRAGHRRRRRHVRRRPPRSTPGPSWTAPPR